MIRGLIALALFLAVSTGANVQQRGTAKAEMTRPPKFPHRIWAACDFESKHYDWFAEPQTKEIPKYEGNVTALGSIVRGDTAAFSGMNPVPGPSMGKVNHLYMRYLVKGSTEALIQHYGMDVNDNNHIQISGLTEGKWSEVTLNFSRDGRRNDGSAGVPFKDGERMDDLQIYVGKTGDGKKYEIFIDDVILFAEDPDLPAEPEPFPNRVIFLASFENGPREFWPGEYDHVKGAPAGSYRYVAQAVPQKEGKGKKVLLKIDPAPPVGARTKLRFHYHLTGVSALKVQLFDQTDQQNRVAQVKNLKQGAWASTYVDFIKDAKRADGKDTPLATGHKVNALSFIVEPEGSGEVALLIDEVVLFDAAEK